VQQAAVGEPAGRGRERACELTEGSAAPRSVSAVSRWCERDTRPMRRVHWLLETTVGRRMVAPALGLRLDVPWATVPAAPVQHLGQAAWPLDAVGRPAVGDTTGAGSRAVRDASGTIGA
jgi:hypothetical protein